MVSHKHINAWAGTGKTTRIIHDFFSEVDYGTDVEKIALISFMNTTINTVKQRLTARGVISKQMKNVCTFHSMCRRLSTVKGTVIKDYDSIFKQKDPFPLAEKPEYKTAYAELMRLRSLLIPITGETLTGRFYVAYTDWKKAHGYIDFTDMLESVYFSGGILKPDCEILFVDELQDCSKIMFGILSQWRAEGIRMVTVGDQDQAISGFTGAEAFGMLEFVDGYASDADALKVSYRLPENILRFAEGYASKNTRRVKIQLEVSVTGGHIGTGSFAGNKKLIIDTLNAGGRVAALSRTFWGCRTIQEELRECGLPIQLPANIRVPMEIVLSGLEQIITPEKGGMLASVVFPKELFYPGAKTFFKNMRTPITLGELMSNPLDYNARGLFRVDAYSMFRDKSLKELKIPEEDKRYYQRLREDQGDNIRSVEVKTFHKFKGDEADVVFVSPLSTGASERGLKSLDVGIREEERRVWLNGLTRAKTHLFLVSHKVMSGYRNSELISYFDKVAGSRF